MRSPKDSRPAGSVRFASPDSDVDGGISFAADSNGKEGMNEMVARKRLVMTKSPSGKTDFLF